ncbi:MAG: hypothetical protein OEW05_03165 [Candidatus Aminicenantes bacterium]|nr:hypothetical protein [Candidatus Aminicenantes bacterium]
MTARRLSEQVRARLERSRPFVTLTKHFFGRFFQNDIVAFEDQVKERLIAVLSILTIAVGWASEMALFKYHFLPDANISWQEKHYIFTLVMLLFGTIVVLEWDVLFPDRQDFANLLPLPIRRSTVFAAKFASFFVFAGLFAVALNIFSSLLFSLYLAPWHSGSIGFAAWHVAAHFISAAAACLFMVLVCVTLHFLTLAAVPPRLARWVSSLVRFALLAAFIFLLVAYIVEPWIMARFFKAVPELKESGAASFYALPSMWFVGLYECLVGNPDPAFARLAGRALLSLGALIVIFLAASGLSYARQLGRALEVRKARPARGSVGRAWDAVVRSVFLRDPAERASYAFFNRILASSQPHRLRLMSFLAVAAGLALIFGLTQAKTFADLTPRNANLLVLPLVLAAAFLVGLRTLADRPAAPEANWAFRVAEPSENAGLLRGFMKAIVARWLVPYAALVFLVFTLIWPAKEASLHALFILTFSTLFLEALFLGYRKIPFACQTVPGQSRIQMRGVLYAVAFVLGLTAIARFEKSLFERPVRFLFFFAAAAVALVLLGLYRRSRFYPGLEIIYEEEPEPALVTLPSLD